MMKPVLLALTLPSLFAPGALACVGQGCANLADDGAPASDDFAAEAAKLSPNCRDADCPGPTDGIAYDRMDSQRTTLDCYAVGCPRYSGQLARPATEQGARVSH